MPFINRLKKLYLILGLVTIGGFLGLNSQFWWPVAKAASIISINAGHEQAKKEWPFTLETVAHFQQPWSIAPTPDGGLLVTEKKGALYQINAQGQKSLVQGLPEVYAQGQNGLLTVALAPDFQESQLIYLSYVAPAGQTSLTDTDKANTHQLPQGENNPTAEGGVLSLLRAQLAQEDGGPALRKAQLIWQQQQPSTGGHPGGIIQFALDGQSLFLTAGERMLGDPAQDLDDARGKILHMGLQGEVPVTNPWAEHSGERAYVWSYGHRNPYGLAFDQQGQLWSHEMGPRGGDEFNLIKAGKNYGWPLVSNGDQYDGRPIPNHDTRPDLEPPLLYWTPVISPSGLAFYFGDYVPWQSSALIGGLSSRALIRVAFDQEGHPYEAERFALGQRIRDVAVGSDGQIWLLEDAPSGRLLRLQFN